MFDQPLQLGSLRLPGRVLLAPLAGVSDSAFRRICQDLGASLTYVEMLNAVAVIHAGRQTTRMMARDAAEPVLGIQVTGKTPVDVARAVSILDKRHYETIDLNMGCPVRKVVHSGGGSAFLKDVARIRETVRLCREATAKPFTVKCRLGWTRDEINIEEVLDAAIGNGADMVTIHGRTRADDYGVPVDLDLIARGMEHARAKWGGRVLLVGNGDVMDHTSAKRMVERTGADAVMISRGALGNPWIFQELREGRRIRPTIEEWLAVVLRHLDYHEACHGNDVYSACRTRKHLLWYATGFPRGSRLREKLNTVETIDLARALIRDFAATVPPGFRRYDDNEPAGHRDAAYDPKFDMDRQLDRGVGDDGFGESA